uniref:Uncharacterized protein n=1 Tax=Rhizophora mucronata TaxID=61149 RepID=A0A2P2PNL4_RHIMU
MRYLNPESTGSLHVRFNPWPEDCAV